MRLMLELLVSSRRDGRLTRCGLVKMIHQNLFERFQERSLTILQCTLNWYISIRYMPGSLSLSLSFSLPRKLNRIRV